jgi:hypothetical protein
MRSFFCNQRYNRETINADIVNMSPVLINAAVFLFRKLSRFIVFFFSPTASKTGCDIAVISSAIPC